MQEVQIRECRVDERSTFGLIKEQRRSRGVERENVVRPRTNWLLLLLLPFSAQLRRLARWFIQNHISIWMSSFLTHSRARNPPPPSLSNVGFVSEQTCVSHSTPLHFFLSSFSPRMTLECNRESKTAPTLNFFCYYLFYFYFVIILVFYLFIYIFGYTVQFHMTRAQVVRPGPNAHFVSLPPPPPPPLFLPHPLVGGPGQRFNFFVETMRPHTRCLSMIVPAFRQGFTPVAHTTKK